MFGPHEVEKMLSTTAHCVTWVIGLLGLNTINPKDSRNVKTQTSYATFSIIE